MLSHKFLKINGLIKKDECICKFLLLYTSIGLQFLNTFIFIIVYLNVLIQLLLL